MKRESIIMPYIGSCLSVNHRLGRRRDGGYYVKPEVKAWQDEYMWLLKRLNLGDWKLPLEVTCSGTFTSEKRACDLVNFQKVVLDPIQTLTGINDKDMRWRDGDRVIDKKQTPHLLIIISEPTTDAVIPQQTSTQGRVKGQSSGLIPNRRKRGLK